MEVTPVLSFDERGHQKNSTTYFVYGSDENGEKPESFYPTVEEFIGEGGTFLNPEAVRINKPENPLEQNFREKRLLEASDSAGKH